MNGPKDLSKSLAVLKRDKRFAHLIKKHGAPAFKWSNFEKGNAFQSLCRSIIYQQVSGAAASTILARFIALFPKSEFPTPEAVRKMPVEKMRSAGLSSQKASYIKDLALKFSDGTIKHQSLNEMTNDEIVKHLTQIKGIGSWTVHMFLIFTLNRSEVLPTGDLGIRKGFKIVYGLKNLPDHAKMEKLAKRWRAHASSASWYFWRVADEGRPKARAKK
ncbi:MAG: DNA-3-methyladenine glycosylase [Candidatus Kaiserbacteria bacterium]|nr:DNA-3-methyladenine glycosylase [Candidatus Kaiserbacteria bacterium]